MGNNTKTPVTINGVEYDFEDLTDQQKVLFNHVLDLERKVASAQFNLDQLQVGREAFLGMLQQSLEAPAEEAEEVPAETTVQ